MMKLMARRALSRIYRRRRRRHGAVQSAALGVGGDGGGGEAAGFPVWRCDCRDISGAVCHVLRPFASQTQTARSRWLAGWLAGASSRQLICRDVHSSRLTRRQTSCMPD